MRNIFSLWGMIFFLFFGVSDGFPAEKEPTERGPAERSLADLEPVERKGLRPLVRAAATPKKPALKSDSGPSPVIAVVNGREITLEMVADHLRALPVEVGVTALERRKQFLDRLVQTELLYQEALRRKLDLSERVQSRLRLARRGIVIQELVDRLPDWIGPPDEKAMLRYYRNNRKKFKRKASARISIIVLVSEKEARETLGELRGGASFEEVARRRSIFKSSGRRGGKLGVVRRGEVDVNLEKAIFSLPIGKESEPIETPAGWQIVRVSERREDADFAFDEVKDEVRNIISRKRRERAFNALLDKLRLESKTVTYPERLK